MKRGRDSQIIAKPIRTCRETAAEFNRRNPSAPISADAVRDTEYRAINKLATALRPLAEELGLVAQKARRP